MTRYQSSAVGSSVKGRLLRGFGWFLLVVLVIGAGIGGGAYLYYNESINAVKAHSHQVTEAEKLLHVLGSPSQPAVALVAGYDHRAGTGTNSYAGSNSDTLMLLRANPKNNTLSLLSFPRDLNVPIYCKGNTISHYDRVNAAWADCGADGGPYAAVDTIEHLAGGVHINYLITLDFRAFQDIVHGLHGVYVNIDRRYYHSNAGTSPGSLDRYSEIDLHPGYQKLSGTQALEYVRFRHLDSDIYRNGRQQLFMEALKARLNSTLSISNISEIPALLHAVKDNLEIAKADGTAVSYGEIHSYLGLLLGLPAGHLFRNSIPPSQLEEFVTDGGADELRASDAAIAGAVHRFLHPVVPKVHHRHKHKHTRGPGTTTPSMPHSDISVLVLNAGNITGEAANTSDLLHHRGFAMKALPSTMYANAPKKTRDTIVYYDPSQDNGEKAAQVLAALFPSRARVEQMTPQIAHPYAQKAGGPLTVVAVGTSFKGKLKGAQRSGGKPQGPSTAHAHVTNGIPATLSAVRSKDGPAHFTLMLPHKLGAVERLGYLYTSTLSTEEGVRLFKPYKGTQELVLTFYLPIGPGEYWQIEESNWTDEPLLSNPTKTFTYKGRKYAEFTSGGAIQQIAVYAGHSVYWVQNTILNSLSNSTMIAIAEGLKPLR